jgi:cyclase
MKNFRIRQGLILFFSLLLISSSLVLATDFKVIRPCDGALILQEPGWALNMTAIDTGSGLVIIDTFASPKVAAKAKLKIKEFFKKPVTHVINTHYHWDHTFGNQVFADAEIIGHTLCAEDMKTEYPDLKAQLAPYDRSLKQMNPTTDQYKWLKQMRADVQSDMRLTPPTVLIGDKKNMRIGSLTFKFYHVPGLHTRSNLTIYIPELGLIFTRSSFHHNSLPRLELGVDMYKLLGSLEDVLSHGKAMKYIIPGHGDPDPDPDLWVPLRYLKNLNQAVKEAIQKGKTQADAEKIFDAGGFDIDENFRDNHRLNLSFLWDALICADRQFDLLVLPDRCHDIHRMPRKTYWREAMGRYFQEHLKPETGK